MFRKAVEVTQPVNDVQLCRVSLERIVCNEADNPRLSDNESYEEIKSSIAASEGRYLVLEVSQRPGSEYFELRRGGKTRLKIATELKHQWDDEGRAGANPFSDINCLVYPWVEESEHRIMNVTENLTRGALSYGEMAKAIGLLEQVYLSMPGAESSMKGFSEWAQQLGLSIKISVAQIQRYKEVNDVLMVMMPKLFIEGRASSVVARQLLEMRAKVRKVFKDHYDNKVDVDSHYQSQMEADSLFNRVAQQYDDVTYQHKNIQRTLRQEIALALPDDIGIQNEFGAAEKGQRRVKFRQHYQLDESSDFGQDDQRNAAIILDRVIGGDYRKDRKVSRRLGMMGIDNDLSGLLRLIGSLDRKGRTLALQAIAEL